jgi:myo-inositol-1(or 4)-monophosphatase
MEWILPIGFSLSRIPVAAIEMEAFGGVSRSMMSSNAEILKRIEGALGEAVVVFSHFASGNVRADRKPSDGSFVTEADRSVNRALHEFLQRDQEGWLSEEDTDDLERLKKQRVWVVDPLDGTREFVAGIPEWSISVAMVEGGQAIAGGVCNPATGEIFLGSKETGVTYNGKQAHASKKDRLEGAVVLASRSEVECGKWACYRQASFVIRPMGSVAYKLARVAAGLEDATWTLESKNDWDVAAGVALVEAAGGYVQFLPNSRPAFNKKATRFPGVFACGPLLRDQITSLLGQYIQAPVPGVAPTTALKETSSDQC